MRTKLTALLLVVAVATLSAGCAAIQKRIAPDDERMTKRDNTKKGAAIGAAAGAVLGAVIGEGEADEILASAAIGAGIGAGVGAYMDKQEEKLSRIPGTTVERVDDDMLEIRFSSDVLFDVDSAVLDGSARAALDEAAAVFIEYKKTAIVAQGHTDSTGSDDYNARLSERRAWSVVDYLATSGVDRARMTALGYGEAHPVADNATPTGRRANRRVVLLLKAKAR